MIRVADQKKLDVSVYHRRAYATFATARSLADGSEVWNESGEETNLPFMWIEADPQSLGKAGAFPQVP